MKKNTVYKLVGLIYLSFSFYNIQAQTINWNSQYKKQSKVVTAQIGAEYGIVSGIGFNYLTRAKKFPLLIGGDFSTSFGGNALDDYKVKIGAQIKLLHINNFIVAFRAQGIFRSNENSSVRLLNFGSDVATTIGYYNKRWFAAAELGYDKAIVTHFNHSQYYNDNIYSKVKDGWYQPTTGGNIYYGLQTGVSFMRNDITIKVGKMVQQDFKTKPLIPYYGQIAFNVWF